MALTAWSLITDSGYTDRRMVISLKTQHPVEEGSEVKRVDLGHPGARAEVRGLVADGGTEHAPSPPHLQASRNQRSLLETSAPFSYGSKFY